MNQPPAPPECDHPGVSQERGKPFRVCADCGAWVLWAWAPGHEQAVPITTRDREDSIRRLAAFEDWLEMWQLERAGGERGMASPDEPVPLAARHGIGREGRVTARPGD